MMHEHDSSSREVMDQPLQRTSSSERQPWRCTDWGGYRSQFLKNVSRPMGAVLYSSLIDFLYDGAKRASL